jgi:hypothetical protein
LRQRLLLFREALICLSYPGCLRTANLVVPRGNAPRSLAYQARALLLSYRTENGIERRPRGTPPDNVVIHRVYPLAISQLPAGRDLTHLQTRAHRGELGLNAFCIHVY